MQKQAIEAEERAKAVMMVWEAEAKAFGLLDERQMKPATLQVRALEALEKVADGKATKMIIPSQIQDIGGLLAAAKEITETKS